MRMKKNNCRPGDLITGRQIGNSIEEGQVIVYRLIILFGIYFISLNNFIIFVLIELKVQS